MQNMDGKVILITGSGSGSGEATARHLAYCAAKFAVQAPRRGNPSAARVNPVLIRRLDAETGEHIGQLPIQPGPNNVLRPDNCPVVLLRSSAVSGRSVVAVTSMRLRLLAV